MSRDLNPVEMLAFEFFEIFSKFEFILKLNNYFQSDRNNRICSVNRRDFAEKYKFILSDTKNEILIADCNELLTNPPKILLSIKVDGELKIDGFEMDPFFVQRTNGKTNFQKVIFHPQNVRNNLFHGTKYYGNYAKFGNDGTKIKSGRNNQKPRSKLRGMKSLVMSASLDS